MKATFENTVDILVKAYLNDTLVRNNCYACAVGNLIADKCGYQFERCIDSPDKKKLVWNGVGGFYFSGEGKYIPNWYDLLLNRDDEADTKEVRAEMAATGYTDNELIRIEKAFERNGDDNFSGLMAVVDVLAEIHGIDLTAKESAKLLFQKA